MKLLGNDLLILRGGTAVAASRSCSVETQADTIETSLPGGGTWKTYLTSRRTWSVDCTWLAAGMAGTAAALLTVGETYTIALRHRNGSETAALSGEAVCTRCRVTATRGNLVQGSFQFKGTGELHASAVVDGAVQPILPGQPGRDPAGEGEPLGPVGGDLGDGQQQEIG